MKITRVLLFNIFLILVVFAMAELFVRFFMHSNATFKERLESSLVYNPSGFISFYPLPAQKVYRYDNGIDYDKSQYTINQYGYRGDDIDLDKAKDEIRIAILGGSHVFDIASFDFDTNPGFPAVLQEAFRNAGYNVRHQWRCSGVRYKIRFS